VNVHAAVYASAATKWTITQHQVDLKHGFCGLQQDFINVNRITDMKMERECLSCCAFLSCCRADEKLTFYSSSVPSPRMEIRGKHARKIHAALKPVMVQNAKRKE
jgi:hypothetical protein